ncbi:MAG: DUF4838 domain-containing protein [Kiritimatiellia bacterium]
MRNLFVIALALGLSGSAAADLKLAVRGQAPAYTIVVPAKASASERYAAEELRDFTERLTGVKLPIVPDGAPMPPRAILLGATAHTAKVLGVKDCAGALAKLGEDGFCLTAKGRHLVVLGSRKRGVLYGVYEILERFGGCGWYASWCSRIPARKSLVVPADYADVQIPAFRMREPFWYDMNVHREFSARLRVNGYNHCAPVPEKFGGDSFRFGGGLGSCHTFETLLPPGRYFDAHPEYFSEVGGKRLKVRSQLCLTNPDVLEIVTSNVLARIRKDPGAKFYGVSQNDWYNYCECAACKAVDDEEESHAGTMIRFVNAVAARVEKEFPHAVIETLAYQYTRKPPKKTKLRHNVVPCLCTIECDFSRPLPDSGYPQNVKFCSDIQGWKTQTDQLYVWDYVTDFANYTMPFANVLTLQGNIRYFRDNNVKELFEQGAYQGRHGDFAELKAWLLAKWMWNPELPAEDLLRDFFSGYYGKGAPHVRAYFDELHERQRTYSSASTDRPLRIFDGVDNPALPDAFLARAAELWAKAAQAAGDDPVCAYNVRMGAFGVDYVRLERLRRQVKDLWLSERPAGDAAFALRRQLARSLLARMAEAKDIRLAENLQRHGELVDAWERIAAQELPPALTNRLAGELQESFLNCSRLGEWGTFVDDPKASDGKALKLSNTHYEWCTTFPLRRVGFDPGATLKIRVRLRGEKATEGEAFWAGVYDPVAKRGRGGIQPKTSQVSDDYAWYDVCTWTPGADDYFWIGPGRFNRDGTAAHRGIWIDKIEISRVQE